MLDKAAKAVIVLATVAAFALSLGPAGATGPQVCPEDNGWSDHQDPPLEQVDGAVEYCVKGGSAQSQGCDGYLEQGSFEEVQAVINAEGACGLSHWGFKLGDPTATPDPTNTPDPTATDTPTDTPTATSTPEDPTATPEDNETPTATFTPTVTETFLPTFTPTPNNTEPPPSGGKG
jgi:hypothetical protein